MTISAQITISSSKGKLIDALRVLWNHSYSTTAFSTIIIVAWAISGTPITSNTEQLISSKLYPKNISDSNPLISNLNTNTKL